MSSSFSPSPLQLSASQLPLGPSPPLPSLLSKLCTLPNITLPLLPVGLGAAAAPYAIVTSHGAVPQAFQYCFEKCRRG